MSRTLLSRVFYVIVRFDIAAQTVHEVNVMVVWLQVEQLVQPTNTTHHSEKVGGELVGAKTVKPKCTYD